MTLILELDLDMVKMNHHTKNEVSVSIASNVIARHTHRQTDTQTLKTSHTREVKIQRIKSFSFVSAPYKECKVGFYD